MGALLCGQQTSQHVNQPVIQRSLWLRKQSATKSAIGFHRTDVMGRSPGRLNGRPWMTVGQTNGQTASLANCWADRRADNLSRHWAARWRTAWAANLSTRHHAEPSTSQPVSQRTCEIANMPTSQSVNPPTCQQANLPTAQLIAFALRLFTIA